MGAVVHISFNDDIPIFGVVQKIFVLSSSVTQVYFQVEIMHTEEYSSIFRSYKVKKIVHPEVCIIPQRTLQYFLPLHLVKPHGLTEEHILPKFDICSFE